MSWTQERVTSTLGHLGAPTADGAFWERVRSDLLTHEREREEITLVMSPSDQPMAEVHALVRSPRRVRWYAAAGAAAAVLIAGLYAVGKGPDQTPGTSQTPADVVLTDLLSLTLDDQPRTAEPVPSRSGYVVLDLTRLPEGWTATVNWAVGVFWSPPGGYRAQYSLVNPAGASYRVLVSSGLIPMPDNPTSVDINGHAGLQGARQLRWKQEPGLNAAVYAPVGASAVDLTRLARSLTFATATELPIVAIDTDAMPPIKKIAQFAGTLNGIRYAAWARSGPLRGIWVHAGNQTVAAVAEDRLVRPTDDPATAGSVNVAGVAGYGVIVFGYTEPATAALRANLADGTTIQVPVLRNAGESYFVLPIPLGVEVANLDFLDVAGATLRTATIPALPAYFGECCATAWWVQS